MVIHVLAVHRDTVETEQAASGSPAGAYSVGVFCWLLSAGVYIAAADDQSRGDQGLRTSEMAFIVTASGAKQRSSWACALLLWASG